MIVWGGMADVQPFGDAGIYDPGSNTWLPIAPSASLADRIYHAAAWDGTRMLVWGGQAEGGAALGDGASYSLGTGTWTPMTLAGAPGARFGHSGTWTGSRFLVWGGGSNTGAAFGSDTPPPPPPPPPATPRFLWHHKTTGELYYWILNGASVSTGMYMTPRAFSDVHWQIRGLVDMNGDVEKDVLWHNQATGELYVWLMTGTTVATGTYLTPAVMPDTAWDIQAVGDFDGNGKPDILWRHRTSGALYYWSMNGTVVASGGYLNPAALTDTDWQVRGLADVSGDGKADAVWHNQRTGQVYVWVMNGGSVTSGFFLPTAGEPWRIVRVQDLNADGRADILWWNAQTADLYIWYSSGAGVASGGYFNPQRMPDTAWQLVRY
jgi:hypothetical protein